MNLFMVGKNWNTPRGGGLDRYFVDLSHHLEAAGANPLAMVHEVGAEGAAYVHAFGRAGDTLPARWLGARRTARRLMLTHPVDLVNLHFALYALPMLDTLKADLPVVCNFHGPWAAESQVEEERRTAQQQAATWLRYRVKWLIEAAVYRRAARFIVLSSAFRQILHREYGVPLERISVIPGGVDTRRFQPAGTRAEARRLLGWPQDRPIVLAVRRLARRMGLEHLVDAIDLVRRRHPDVLLLIGGRGILEAELRRRIAERNLEQHVRLAGFIADEQLPLAYRAADFSVVPTVALEGFGLIIIESLACGTPCLGTPVGGIPEVLGPFDPSLLVESTGAAALADRMETILSGRTVLPSEQACRAYTMERFAWERVTQQVLRVFDETRGGVYREAGAVSEP